MSTLDDENYLSIIERIELRAAIVGPLIGDILWYGPRWRPGLFEREQGSIQEVLALAALADMFALATVDSATRIVHDGDASYASKDTV